MSYLQDPPKFCHKVNGKTYTGGTEACNTIQEYRDYLRVVYGNLRGVKVLELGKGFDGIMIIGDHKHAVKDGRYV